MTRRPAAPMAALLAALLALPLPAMALTQLQTSVERALRDYGFAEIDVTRLSVSQLQAVHSTANLPGKEGGKRGMIRSILGQGLISGRLR